LRVLFLGLCSLIGAALSVALLAPAISQDKGHAEPAVSSFRSWHISPSAPALSIAVTGLSVVESPDQVFWLAIRNDGSKAVSCPVALDPVLLVRDSAGQRVRRDGILAPVPMSGRPDIFPDRGAVRLYGPYYLNEFYTHLSAGSYRAELSVSCGSVSFEIKSFDVIVE